MVESVDDVLIGLESNLEKNINKLITDFNSVRAGRANPHILDRVFVDYYGTRTPIQQTANITVADARSLVVAPWDVSLVKAISTAISDANLGISIGDDGKIVRLSFPIMTEERRKDLVKDIKKVTEDCNISIRASRKDAMDILKDMKKDNNLSEDDFDRAGKDVQKFVDGTTDKAQTLSDKKIAEVMEV